MHFNVNAFVNSFFPPVIDVQNKLPDSVLNAANINDLKDRLDNPILMLQFAILHMVTTMAIRTGANLGYSKGRG